MTKLDTWYLLRLEQEVLKARLANVTEAATDEAMERVAGEKKKTFPIGGGGHKIQVRFTNKKIKPSDHPDLETLDEEIKLEAEAAARENASDISQIEKDLDSLTKRLEELKQTDRGRALQGEYDELVEQLAEKVPVLALKRV